MSDENEKKCSCGCGCGEDCDCGCQEGKECTCGDDCKCGEHKDAEQKGCGCGCGNHGEENAADDIEKILAQDYPLPKPSLVMLATTFAQQAMVSMGILPNPMTGKSVFMMNQATHLVDTVDLLIEKTAGNRTDEETKVLNDILHELRMMFVAASNEKKRRETGEN
ncbi:MAG: DUF1844 domain-containing protein [Thermoguttaceae bacterium]|nr:DUF1844 domain-containing protein [Thermoguttaceae bacterium]